MSHLRATKDRLLVLPAPPATMDGIFHIRNPLPSTQGRVVSVGPEMHDVRAGDHVSFKPFSGTDVEHEGVKYRVLEPGDLLLLLDTQDVVSAGEA